MGQANRTRRSNLLRSWSHAGHGKTRMSGSPARRLKIESLENRLMLATTVYVDDDFTGTDGTPITDADPVAVGNQAAVIGVDAFATIQAGVDAVDSGGTVKVNSHGPNAAPSGAYAESVSIATSLTLDGNAISGLATDVVIDPAAGNGITRVRRRRGQRHHPRPACDRRR
jgi:hypothetical protein